MSERERWTVYPLLLFTLALVCKDKVVPPTYEQLQAEQIVCTSLDAQRIQTTSVASRVLVADDANLKKLVAQQHDVVQLKSRDLTVVDGEGKELVHLIGVDPLGGRIELHAPDGRLLVTLGADKLNGAGALGTFVSQDQPLAVLDSNDNTGRFMLFSQRNAPGDPSQTCKVLLYTEQNHWGAGLVFDDHAQPHPLATLRITRVIPPGASPSSGGPAATAPTVTAPAVTAPAEGAAESPEQAPRESEDPRDPEAEATHEGTGAEPATTAPVEEPTDTQQPEPPAGSAEQPLSAPDESPE